MVQHSRPVYGVRAPVPGTATASFHLALCRPYLPPPPTAHPPPSEAARQPGPETECLRRHSTRALTARGRSLTIRSPSIPVAALFIRCYRPWTPMDARRPLPASGQRRPSLSNLFFYFFYFLLRHQGDIELSHSSRSLLVISNLQPPPSCPGSPANRCSQSRLHPFPSLSSLLQLLSLPAQPPTHILACPASLATQTNSPGLIAS